VVLENFALTVSEVDLIACQGNYPAQVSSAIWSSTELDQVNTHALEYHRGSVTNANSYSLLIMAAR